MPKITNIFSQKRAKNRFNVHLDGKYSFPVSEKVLLAFKLKKGLDLSNESIEEIIQEENFEKTYNKTLNFLSYRLRSRNELEKRLEEYLLKSGIDKKQSLKFRKKVMETLDDLGLIDDDQFVSSYISDSINAKVPLGRRKIFEYMFKRGVDRKVVEKNLEKYSLEAEIVGAEKVFDKKIRSLKEKRGYKARQKMYKFLAGKGYSTEAINAVIDRKFEV